MRYAILHNSGTGTMQSCLLAAGVGPGDEVIVHQNEPAVQTTAHVQAMVRRRFDIARQEKPLEADEVEESADDALLLDEDEEEDDAVPDADADTEATDGDAVESEAEALLATADDAGDDEDAAADEEPADNR